MESCLGEPIVDRPTCPTHRTGDDGAVAVGQEEIELDACHLVTVGDGATGREARTVGRHIRGDKLWRNRIDQHRLRQRLAGVAGDVVTDKGEGGRHPIAKLRGQERPTIVWLDILARATGTTRTSTQLGRIRRQVVGQAPRQRPFRRAKEPIIQGRLRCRGEGQLGWCSIHHHR